jgi:hypothetical protein
MAVPASELQRWAFTLPGDALVGVDEGGLTLVVEDSDAYLEVGGMSEGEDTQPDPDDCTCDDRSWHGEEHDSACPLEGKRENQ